MNAQNNSYSKTQKWTLVVTIIASSLAFIDATALNVALPAIQKDLGMTGTQLLWVINGYMLFLSSLLMVGGALGDLYGRNKIFQIGLVIFALASLSCGFAVNPMHLLLSRAVQGIGGALLTPGSLSILSAQFDEDNRGRAFGLWSMFSALTSILGPILGGWLAEIGWWRAIFFLNTPFAVFILLVMNSRIPESRNTHAEKLDIYGAILVTLGLAGITYGFTESSNYGIFDPMVLTSVTLGVIAMIGFIFLEKHSTHPMMPLSLFSSTVFSVTNIITFLIYAAMGGALFFVPLNLIQIQGYSGIEAGLSLLPVILCIAIISPSMGKIVDRYGFRNSLLIAPIITALGFAAFVLAGKTAGPSAYFSTYFVPFLLVGIGMGIITAPLTTAVMGAVDEKHVGVASGINNTIARAANVLAVAFMGSWGLIAFKSKVSDQLKDSDLHQGLKDRVLSEASNFTAAKAPEFLQQSLQLQIQDIYQRAFLYSFDEVMIIASVITVLSTVATLVVYRKIK
ncbi:MFS transporter [Flammeovirga sp. SubArs3]|uniref:MFS transporter n=1 Tax=Flammeovirga sp. SubArs3 TaxID=2995316 RepID=UPI00248C1109|nr:MFS transporter [Flammeovirga sp. SubArs3]